MTPNPSFGSFGVSFSFPAAAPAKLEVFDASGRLVTRRDMAGGAGRDRVTFDEPALRAPGLYFVRLDGPDGTAHARAIVLR